MAAQADGEGVERLAVGELGFQAVHLGQEFMVRHFLKGPRFLVEVERSIKRRSNRRGVDRTF